MPLRETKYRILIPLNKANERYRNDKGRLFEGIVGQFLKNQSFTVKERVRDVGSEIDLLCSNDLSGDIAVVECKTQTEALPSSVVNKLHTDVSLHDAHVGWIFSISDLGKEAEGRLKKLNEKGGKETFRHFSPSTLVGHLLNISALIEPTVVHQNAPNEKYLCIFENRYLWVYPVHESSSGQPIALRAWNAETGKAISPSEAPDLTDTDFPFPELRWLDHEAGESSATKQTQPVVEVIPGEEWSDYRPSRPDDFVGRKRVIEDIGEFFDRVRNEETSSRLFGVKGQSGWGKSSLALKLAAEFGKSKTIVVPVDCRAAKTSIYPNLVLDRAFKLAANRLYPGPLFQLNTKFEANPFEEDTLDVLQEAKMAFALSIQSIWERQLRAYMRAPIACSTRIRPSVCRRIRSDQIGRCAAHWRKGSQAPTAAPKRRPQMAHKYQPPKFWTCDCDRTTGGHIIDGHYSTCVYCGKHGHEMKEIVVRSGLGGVFCVEILSVEDDCAKVKVVKSSTGFDALHCAVQGHPPASEAQGGMSKRE